MCGRYTLTVDPNLIMAEYQIINDFTDQYEMRYNIAPSQGALSIISDGENRRAGYLRWGLIPFWSKDEKIGYKLINARSETLHEKPSFKNAFKKRRCLVMADGFYEWKRTEDKKQPMRITLKDKKIFAMAGLWEKWTSPEGQDIHSCTIITTKPNDLMEEIHDRMPAILTREQEQIWLNRSIEDTNILQDVLTPYDASKMEAYKVSTLVNSPKNDSEVLMERVVEQQ
ncbi:SOS response-associated peptidase [Bacillus sp. FJAT-45350]|uniref:SOS response-associated peptidase n=1 Tax=Bacillus sp. FJAT-45350 TaxID=2011014 RepID=UPI000BB7568C|nr:SOS response-associated peptidase [Bacillus sp. FJAT-45350]